MKQLTVRTAMEAWAWIHSNDHQEVGTIYHPVKKDEYGLPQRTHIFMRNYFFTLRIPEALLPEVMEGLHPNRRPFDTRMYALNPKQRAMVRASRLRP